MEIEKKYLIAYLPNDFYLYEKKEIVQGYLNTHPTIRIRKSNDEYYLTYKSNRGTKETKDLLINEEVELPLTKESFEHLCDKVDNHLIQKTRTIIPLGSYYSKADGNYKLNAEVDIFHGKLEGLCFAEVEFPSVEASECFDKPEWLDKDVSSDKRYRNSYLSKLNSLSEM